MAFFLFDFLVLISPYSTQIHLANRVCWLIKFIDGPTEKTPTPTSLLTLCGSDYRRSLLLLVK